MTERDSGMQEEPGVFDVADEAADEAATQRALADIAAGRVVSHEAVSRWLKSLSTDNPLPRPKWGE